MEKWLHSDMIYQGRIVSLRVGDACLEDGTVAPREVVEHSGGVGIVPVVDGSVVLVKQFRIAVNDYVLEIPAGRLEPGEDPEHRARCELEEEAGYRSGRFVLAAECYPSPGFTNQVDYIYLAFDLVPCEARPEYDERIEVVRVPIAEIPERLARNEFKDAKTIIGFHELLARLRQEQ